MLYRHVWTAAIALLTQRGAPSGRLNGLDRLGCRFLAKSLGQVADLGLWGSGGDRPGSSGREACLLWPSGTRSWVRHAGCRRPRRYGGSWLRPCRWVGLPRRIPFVRRTPTAEPGPGSDRLFVRHRRRRPAAQTVPRCPRWMLDEQGDYSIPDQASRHSPLGSFSTQLPSAPDGDLSPDAGHGQLHRVQAGVFPGPAERHGRSYAFLAISFQAVQASMSPVENSAWLVRDHSGAAQMQH